MIVKIQLRNQDEVGKLFAVLCSDDNHPPLEAAFNFFTTTGEVLDGLAQDMGGVKRDQGLYLVTLKVADFVGIISDTDRKPFWPMTWAVPVEWIQKIFNAFGRFPAKVQPSKPAEPTTVGFPLISVSDILRVLYCSRCDEPELTALLCGLMKFFSKTQCGCTWTRDEIKDLLCGRPDKASDNQKVAAQTLADFLVTELANAHKPAEPKPGVIPLTPEFLRAFHAIGTLPLEYHPHTFGAWLVGIVVRYYENAPDLRFQLDQAGALNSELKDDIYFKLIVAHLRKHCLGETE